MKLAMVCLTLLVGVSISFAKDFSVMTYNLENLFDTQHDEGKTDWTYLPLAFKRNSKEVQKYCATLTNQYYRQSCLEYDWNQEKLDQKMSNLAEVIRFANRGQGADILVFEEVENIKVLSELFNKYLLNLGYKNILLHEGPDSRGIDVAIVTRFDVLEQKYHRIKLKGHHETRGILEAKLSVHNKIVTIFANHWPSQANPDQERLAAAKVLANASYQASRSSDVIIAMGDFNTLPDDTPHGINQMLLRNKKNPFVDITMDQMARQSHTPHGTHWYRGEWSMLDRIFVLKKSLSHIQTRWEEFQILRQNFMLTSFSYRDNQTGNTVYARNVPKRFDEATGEGYSDHLPVFMSFEVK